MELALDLELLWVALWGALIGACVIAIRRKLKVRRWWE